MISKISKLYLFRISQFCHRTCIFMCWFSKSWDFCRHWHISKVTQKEKHWINLLGDRRSYLNWWRDTHVTDVKFWQVNMSDNWTTRGLRVCHRQITQFCLQWFSSYTHEILWTRGSINQLCGRRSLSVQPGLRIECRESMDLNDKEQLWSIKKEQIRK